MSKLFILTTTTAIIANTIVFPSLTSGQNTTTATTSCLNANVYERCKSDNDLFESSTCGYLQSRNATFYAQCLCYSSVNRERCISSCPDDPVAIAENNGVVTRRTQRCAAANLQTPLPNPAPWQSFFPNLGAGVNNSSNGNSSTNTNNNGGNPKSTAQKTLSSTGTTTITMIGVILSSLLTF